MRRYLWPTGLFTHIMFSSIARSAATATFIEEWLEEASPYEDEFEGQGFIPYEVLTTTDTETLIRQLTTHVNAKVRVRRRDTPREDWYLGIAMIDREHGSIAINCESGYKEILLLKDMFLNCETNRHLIEIDGPSVVYSLHLYDDANLDSDWGYFAEEPEAFKKYVQDLPTYLKYIGMRKTIHELRMFVWGIRDYA
jgi:hypothetical protein